MTHLREDSCRPRGVRRVAVLDQQAGDAFEFVAELAQLAFVHGVAGAESAQLFLTTGLVFLGDKALGFPFVGPLGEIELPRHLLPLALPRSLGIGFGAG